MRLREVKMGGKRSIISLIIVCLIGCMLCGCDKKQDTEKEIGKNAPKIVVGSDNYPPFNYMDENGNPTGIDVDIATEAFKRLGYRVEFVNIEWEDKKNLVENGDIDCIWGCFSIKGRSLKAGIVIIIGILLSIVFNKAFCGFSVVAKIKRHFEEYQFSLSPTL